MTRWFYKAPLRLRALFRRNRVEQELNDELCFHVDCLTEENIKRGQSPKEARESALRELGGIEQFKEECRDARRISIIETVMQDLRYGLRMLVKNPGFSAVVVLILTLGICSTSTIFSVIDGLILRPLPAENPDQLVWIHINREGNHSPSMAVSYKDYLDMCRQSTAFSAIVASTLQGVLLNTGDQVQLISGEFVSDNYFSVLGIPAALGRTFVPGENWARFQATPVVISYGLWQRQFGADPGVIGKEARIGETNAVILGVAPAWYTRFHKGRNSTELWLSLNWLAGTLKLHDKELSRKRFDLLGRLRSGSGVEQARVEMDGMAHQFAESFPAAYKGLNFNLIKETDERRENMLVASLMMLGVGMVLVICCANISGMMLARAEARQCEVAIRMALGAGRRRLLRQLLTESSILALLGGGLGLVFTFWLLRLQSMLMPAGLLLMRLDIRMDARVIIFTSAITLITALLTGLAPALRASRPDLIATLKREQRRSRIGGLWLGERSILLVGQMALSLILVVGAGIFLKSLIASERIDPGFDTSKNLLNMFVKLSVKGESAHQGFFIPIVEKIRALPGVKNASYASGMWDTNGGTKGMEVAIPGVEPPSGKKGFEIGYNMIGPDYFRTIGKRIVRGRFFDMGNRTIGLQDVIINKTMAEQFWPQTDPIGKFIRSGNRNFQIIGVAQDGRNFGDLRKDPEPYLYFPFTNSPVAGGYFVLETAGDHLLLVQAIKREILSMDKGAKLMVLETAKDAIGRALWFDRILFLLVGALGCIGVFITSVGLYGVVAYMMQRRTQEIGIRLALGARRQDVIRMGIRHGLTLALLGICAGLGPAVLIAGVLMESKAGISSVDPLVLIGACMFVLVVTLLACCIPARRASKIDPMTALRCE